MEGGVSDFKVLCIEIVRHENLLGCKVFGALILIPWARNSQFNEMTRESTEGHSPDLPSEGEDLILLKLGQTPFHLSPANNT